LAAVAYRVHLAPNVSNDRARLAQAREETEHGGDSQGARSPGIRAPVNRVSLYQINTRPWLTERSLELGRPATLDDVPDEELNRLARAGFNWVWLLSVWTTGLAGRQVSRSQESWRNEFKEALPDLKEEDIAGSGFAIASYSVHPALGGDAALARLRRRLAERGLKLLLDFVPNHTALDHGWVQSHPEYFVAGTEADLAREPKNYVRVRGQQGDLIVAHGRDPYFPGWPDTLQLDYGNAATQAAMTQELLGIADRCDGVRCDMAMLVLADVFERTWGRKAKPFWPTAVGAVRERAPNFGFFGFVAEVYWDLEWTILQEGFDFAYDKRLYDRLRAGVARPVREHLRADLGYQNKMVRFLENHDEPRAAATFGRKMHEAAAVLTYLSPGLCFFHQGQFEGRRVRLSPHLVRWPREPVDDELRAFYGALLDVLREPAAREGQWTLHDCLPAWDGNGSSDAFIASSWKREGGDPLMSCVNYSPNQGQCYVRLPAAEWEGRRVVFKDLMSPARYERSGDDVRSRGLYLDLPPWGFHVFACSLADGTP
jgi:Alpha amylase, catalytic domain